MNEANGTTLDWFKHALEYLGGEQDDPPPGYPAAFGNWWFWALWWGALSTGIYIFSGQSSKFIYIDF
jgi:hypothetical protein